MVIGALETSAPLDWLEVFDLVVLTGLFVAGVVSVITEIIVVAGMIAINKLFAATTPTVAVKHPSKHNIY